MNTIRCIEGGFRLFVDDRLVLEHTDAAPALFVGIGREDITMFRGNFQIHDACEARHALRLERVEQDGTALYFSFPDGNGGLRLSVCEENGYIRLTTTCEDPAINRFWIRFIAEAGEHVVGGGEQFSYLDLRGRTYPIWTREQGVGRNKATRITQMADADDGGGGDYHTTYFPQPTFVSSRGYFVHLDNAHYSELDFRDEHFHEVAVWTPNTSFVLAAGESYFTLCEKLTGYLGRQLPLPDWAMDGIWLGVQGGTETVLKHLKACRDGGIQIPVAWIQDWEGKRVTSFGKRLQWDWRWNQQMYPGLDKIIRDDPNTLWMAYCNPHLVEGGVLYGEAKEKGYFIKHADGSDYIYDFGEFNCGVVDLTMPEAFDWYKNVIKTNIIGMGFKGWMADFGEYIPADCVCYGGTGMEVHNQWPTLWARCNREAVVEAGVEGDCVFFTRSGFTGTQRYSTLMFCGDQCVDWTPDDGIPSVITGALSMGVSGYGLATFDIGGYTSLFDLKRTDELICRSMEMACFTPVMRTHEGNRPDTNVQLYSTDELIAFGARMARIHTELKPYLRHVMEINAQRGIPTLRPLFFEAPQADQAYDRDQFSFMLGDDILAAPVVKEGETTRTLWLPEGEWIHLWTGESYGGGDHTVAAPLGQPPVFYRKGSAFTELFRTFAGR